MQKKLGPVLTLAVLGMIFWWTQKRPPAQSVKEKSPEATIWRMLEASKAGNIAAYLDCYEGDLQARLKNLCAEKGRQEFQNYLKRLMTPVKGIAQTRERDEGDRVQIKVEYIFQDRNEVQTFLLGKIGGGWKILTVSEAQRVPTIIPYGTEVR